MKLKTVLAIGDVLRVLRAILPCNAYALVYAELESLCRRNHREFNVIKWRAWIARE